MIYFCYICWLIEFWYFDSIIYFECVVLKFIWLGMAEALRSKDPSKEPKRKAIKWHRVEVWVLARLRDCDLVECFLCHKKKCILELSDLKQHFIEAFGDVAKCLKSTWDYKRAQEVSTKENDEHGIDPRRPRWWWWRSYSNNINALTN